MGSRACGLFTTGPPGKSLKRIFLKHFFVWTRYVQEERLSRRIIHHGNPHRWFDFETAFEELQGHRETGLQEAEMSRFVQNVQGVRKLAWWWVVGMGTRKILTYPDGKSQALW